MSQENRPAAWNLGVKTKAHVAASERVEAAVLRRAAKARCRQSRSHGIVECLTVPAKLFARAPAATRLAVRFAVDAV